MCNNKSKNFHIHIEYCGGETITRYSEYNQRIRLFKKADVYGNDKLVVCSSAWYEYELTIKNNESQYVLMLSDGEFIHVGVLPRNVKLNKEYGDEVVVVKISSFEDLYLY